MISRMKLTAGLNSSFKTAGERVNDGRYQVVEEIGRGRRGVVYRAYDPRMNREVALKILRFDQAESESCINRFLQSMNLLSGLSHPNIVKVYEVVRQGADLYIVMEFIEGSPLNDLLRVITLSLERIVEIGILTAQALNYAHQKGVLHGDIRPSNILLKPDRTIVISDFGWSSFDAGGLSPRAEVIAGNPVYPSPEQVMGKTVDGRADIFSLGALLYELLTGRKPFGDIEGDSTSVVNDILHRTPRPPASVSNEIGENLSSVIMKCLSREPSGRYSTGDELAQALKSCLAKSEWTESGVPVTQERKKERKKSRAFPWAVLGGMAFFLLVLGVGVYLYDRQVAFVPSGASFKHEGPVAGKKPPPAPTEQRETTKQDLLPLPSIRQEKGVLPAHEKRAPEPENVRQEEKGKPAAASRDAGVAKSTPKKQAPVTGKTVPAVSQTAVTILSQPEGASAYVDERKRGRTPVTLMLPVGKHRLRISLPGYQEIHKEITILETMEYPLSFQLRPMDESD